MGGGFDGRVSKVYGPAKRRTASADRSFPVGCGRNAAVVRTGDQPRPPVAAAATANNGSRLAFLEKSDEEQRPPSLEKSDGERRPPSAQTSRQDAPTAEDAGREQIVADKLEPEEYSDWMEAAEREGEEVVAILGNGVKEKVVEEANSTGRGEVDSERTKRGLALTPAGDMLTVGISKLFGPAKMRRVSADRCFPAGCGRTPAAAATAACGEELGAAQEEHSERAERSLGHQKSPEMMPAVDMLSGEISKVFGPAKKRGVSVERRFPAGCGRTAAAARKGGPGAAQEGGSKTAVRRADESRVKKKPEETNNQGSKVGLHNAKVVRPGNQAPRSLTATKHKLFAVRRSPFGTGANAGKLLERSHGGQARGGGRGREDGPAGLARGKRPPLAATKSPLLPRGGAAGKGGEASEGATSPELHADRIVMVIMAASRCPWRGRSYAK